MEIQHKESEHRGKFFIENEGKRVAQIVYAKGGDKTIIIEHTEVDESLRGKKIGYDLVQKTVEYARAEGLKVSPVCQFAKAVFDRHPDYADVQA